MHGVPQFSCFNSVLDTEYVASARLSSNPGAQPQADPCCRIRSPRPCPGSVSKAGAGWVFLL